MARAYLFVTLLGSLVLVAPGCGGGETASDGGLDAPSSSDPDAAGSDAAGSDAPAAADAPVAIDDGAAPDAPRAGDGVRCIGAPADCAAGEVCCSTPVETRCQAASMPCTGPAIACDGPEDCPGQACCGTGPGTSCAATCPADRICHETSECGAGESCCPIGGGPPRGALEHCIVLPPGTPCPLPP
jgi:hypothetical protein